MQEIKKLLEIMQALRDPDAGCPWDIEQEVGMTEGNISHGELTLDQLFFMRPTPGWAKYRTPIRNYYQCGSGTHPGGGITGTPAQLAVSEMFKDGI